jgi:hypothetical protein
MDPSPFSRPSLSHGNTQAKTFGCTKALFLEINCAVEGSIHVAADKRSNEMSEKTRGEPAEVLRLSDEEEISYPEGGVEAWLVVLGSFCGM